MTPDESVMLRGLQAKEREEQQAAKKPTFTESRLREVAQEVVAKGFTHTDGERTVMRWHGSWWCWADGTWDQLKVGEFQDRIVGVLTAPEPTGLAMEHLPMSLLERILLYVRLAVDVDKWQQMETWLPSTALGDSDLDLSGTWVNCKDHLLRTADWDPKKDLEIKVPHTPRYFTVCKIPRPAAPSPPPKEWLKFLDQVLEGDQERIGLLQEWFGYCCLPTTRFHKMLMLIGEGRNGKSTVLTVLQEMLGGDNVSHVSLARMAGKYGPFSTFGKLANILGDITTRYLKDPGELKAFIAGEKIEFERKYCDAFSTHPTARLCFSMNTMPRTDDDSEGFWDRLIIMPFRFRPKKQNTEYGDKNSPLWIFRDELDAIFVWALEGLIRLTNNEGFSKATQCTLEAEAWRKANESVRRYVEERLEYDPQAMTRGQSTPVSTVSADYAKWSESQREKPFSSASFARRLKRVLPGLERQKFKFGQTRENHWSGLTIRKDIPVLNPNLRT